MDDLLKRLLKPRKPKPAKVEIEPGAFLFVLDPSPNQRDLFEMQWLAFKRGESNIGLRAFAITWFLCDHENNRVFNSGHEEDSVKPEFAKQVDLIGQGKTHFTGEALAKIWDAAAISAGISKADEAELVKSSATIPADGGNGSRPKPTGKAGRSGSRNSKIPAS